ncbi:hypothetical protein AVEN_58192-1 [Araneus ventricosus]|uniref:Uncharacterized protein n=1 Tax=Araneus ventricosus TaxID=182803 RepID=A0A4Y2K848_ARAVE|nr:hypothetical protein AVEN_58192-1 [Araneus ventricosus]
MTNGCTTTIQAVKEGDQHLGNQQARLEDEPEQEGDSLYLMGLSRNYQQRIPEKRTDYQQCNIQQQANQSSRWNSRKTKKRVQKEGGSLSSR